MIYSIYSIILICLIINEIQKEQDAIKHYLDTKVQERQKTDGQKFYSSTAWKVAKKECFRLQMERTGLTIIECEICGATSMDLDESGKKVVMSVGHDKARSTHPHLALDQDNLFPQCMGCNTGQGINQRIR